MSNLNNKNATIIVPVYNEEQSIEPLAKEIVSECSFLLDWEIIFIDDGSTDDSQNILNSLSSSDSRIKVLSLNRNLGKSIALAEGFSHAQYENIITMDGDLQDDPKEIRGMLSKLDEGYDLVSGWKRDRKDPLSKRVWSKIFNFITSLITGIRLHDFNCGIKAYKKKSVLGLDLYGGMHRYIPVILHNKGFKVSEIVVNHRKREFGDSKYGKSRIVHGFFDFLTVLFLSKYFDRPLHFFGSFGFPVFLSGLSICIYLSVQWLQGIWIANRPLFFLGILLVLVGIQFISIGLIGELFINKTASNTKRIIDKSNFEK